MPTLENMAKDMLASFDSKDKAREEAYRLSREVIRLCSSSIRSVHREDLGEANKLLREAASGLERIKLILRDHQDVRYAGFVDGAESGVYRASPRNPEARHLFPIAHQQESAADRRVVPRLARNPRILSCQKI